MYFRPLQILGTMGLLLILAGISVGITGKLMTDEVPDVLTSSLFSTGVVFVGLGLLGDLVNARRSPL
jgi:putative effector of murein hydrolase LrgA (UPF0299 family)